MSRRSEVSNKSNKVDFNLSLFEHALKDPASKNLILQLLSGNNKNVIDLLNPDKAKLNSPVRRVKKREHCESPTALLRRRELEKINRPESAISQTSEQSVESTTSDRNSSVPFENILKNVVAYVEINSNGVDRSGGAKALLRSMGATVSEKFSRDVTHVIFKDGLYTTYQRAKLLKVHLVSVLWLEASRRNGVKAQEKQYPALGTKNYDLNVSTICSQLQKDYEEVIRDEIRKTLQSGTPLPFTKTYMEDRRKTVGSNSKSFGTSSQFGQSICGNEMNMVVSRIQEKSKSKKIQPPSMTLGNDSSTVSTDEDLSMISKKIQSDMWNSSTESFRPNSLRLDAYAESDSASECGMIDGNFSQKESIINSTLGVNGPLLSNKFPASDMELTCSKDPSESFLSTRNRTSNLTTSMDQTNPSGGGILQNLKGSLLNSLSYLTSKNPSSSNSVKRRETKEKENSYAPSTRSTPKRSKKQTITTNSNTRQTRKDSFFKPTLENENAMSEDDFYKLKTPKFEASKKNLPKPANIFKDDANEGEQSTEMSSLRISDSKDKASINKLSERISDTTKKSTESSMPSLRLSKSSVENSSLPEVSCSKVSLEKTEKIGDTTDDSSQADQNICSPKPLSTTPFVTERKKRNTRTSLRANLFAGLDNSSSSEPLIRNTRSSRRESEKLQREKEDFKKELEKMEDSHDKEREVELVTTRDSEVTTPRPARKFPSKTPKKPEVFISPFVNTRRRRKSRVVEEEPVVTDEEANVEDVARRTRHSSRISQSKKSPEKIREKTAPAVSPKKNEKLLDEDTEPRILPDIIEEDEDTHKNNSSNKSVVLLQDLLVTPPDKSKSSEKKKRKLQQEECVVSLVSISNKDSECSPPKRMRNNESPNSSKKSNKRTTSDKNNERKSRRMTLRLNSEGAQKQDKSIQGAGKVEVVNDQVKTMRKVLRSKSESDVGASTATRRSRRIRKLYDPNQLEQEEKIQEILVVNDQEERETIRREKVLKVHLESNNKWLAGDVLMTQKALEFLENTQENGTRLFKEPETVLEHLGIDRGKKKEKKKESIMNNSADEQVELAEEFIKKKNKKRVEEYGASQKTPKTQKSSRYLSQKSLTTGNRKRRSTMEFVPTPLSMPEVRIKLNLDQKPTIVCTKLHNEEVQVFNQIVEKLGRFEVEDEVSSRTTHLVVGEIKRTVNMLRALARGCWILKHEWLLSSLEEERWLPEENYEATEFSPAVQQCRLRRQAFGPSYHMNIFLHCGAIYVAKCTIPRCSDIRELITLCGGKVTKTPDNAKISVGAYLDGCDCVSELWVLDSITSGKLELLENYVIRADCMKTKSPFV